MLTIPEYFKKYIDSKVDLDLDPKCCCPFHEEKTPSFSYSAERNHWQCFGACNTGGDVFALHMKNKKLRSYNDAVIDLCRLEGEEYSDVLKASAKDYTESDIEQMLLIDKILNLDPKSNEFRDMIQYITKFPLGVD